MLAGIENTGKSRLSVKEVAAMRRTSSRMIEHLDLSAVIEELRET